MSVRNPGAVECATRSSSRRRGLARPAALSAIGLGVVLTALSIVPGSARAASAVDGAAVITDPTTNAPITAAQGSATPFTIDLPANASCDHDSATGGYRIYSYVIPGPLSSSTLTSTLQGLNLATDATVKYLPLLDTGGNPYGPANTAIGTGQITNIPTFSWAPLQAIILGATPPQTLIGTTQEVGIACGDSTGAMKDYWNQEVSFTASTSDTNGFTWTPGASGPITPTTTTSTTEPVNGVTTTTAPGGGASTTTTSTTTATTTPSSTTTTVSGATTTSTSASSGGGTGTSGGINSASGSSGQSSGSGTGGSGSHLSSTGAEVKPELNIGVLLIGGGALLLCLIPRGRVVAARASRRQK